MVCSQKIGSFHQRLCYLSEICFHFDCNFLRVCLLIFKCVTLNNTTFHCDKPGGRLHICASKAGDYVQSFKYTIIRFYLADWLSLSENGWKQFGTFIEQRSLYCIESIFDFSFFSVAERLAVQIWLFLQYFLFFN